MEEGGNPSVPVSAHVVVLGPLVLALAAMLASRFGAAEGASWDVAWTAAGCSALAATWLARGRAHEQNRARWGLWATATAAWLAGQLAWDLYGVIGFPQSPNVADAAWWAFALLVMASMLRMPDGSGSARAVARIETGLLIAAALALVTAELWKPAMDSTLALGPKLSALAYPAVYVSAAVLTLQAMFGGALRTLNSTAMRLVLSGLAAQALAFTIWSAQLLARSYAPGHSLLDPLWVLGLAAIAAGGLVAARKPEAAAVAAEPNHRSGVLPAGMFLVLLLALVQAHIEHAPAGFQTAVLAGLTVCGGALIARSALLEWSLRGLLSRERAAVANLAQHKLELARLNEQLIVDARHDPLTGVHNRRALADDLPLLEQVQHEPGETFAFALCDADRFKAYNDRLGHLAGDQALRMIATTVRGVLRAGDAAYRFGGEELLLVLRKIDGREAARVAERVRAAVERAAFPHPDADTGVLTVSIGVAVGSGETGALLARADAALYEAKQLGRNRVVAAAEGSPLPAVGRQRALTVEELVPTHLRGMLAVSRAAAAGRGVTPVLEALAEAIRTELSFQVVVVNVLDERREQLKVVVVRGDQEARATLLGTSSSWSNWQPVLDAGMDACGAIWLPAGSYDWDFDAATWTPPAVAALASDGWHPEDMLLLPLRGATGEVLGVVSVDQPVLGRRPTEEELSVLMAVADHAGLALEQAKRDDGIARRQSHELLLAAVMLLAETLDMRDPSTAQHSRTVGRHAREAALALELAPERVERVHAAGVLHDLGKLGIADAVLHKPGPLSAAEWEEMRRHPEIGAQILEHAGMHDIAGWVRTHHERLDGRGYPAGLRAASISLEARILAVADAYEAMTADRPYRTCMSPNEAREELLRHAGAQFDPVVVEALLRTLDAGAEDRHPLVERVA